MKKRTTLLFSLLLLVLGGTVLTAQSVLNLESEVTLKNESKINTGELEYCPTFYENGIVYISDTKVGDGGLLDIKINKNTMSIFRAKRDEDGSLGEPQTFSEEITTKYHEGPLTFNKTNDQIFFTRDNYVDGKAVKAKDGIIKLQIFSSEQKDGKWGAVNKLAFNDKDNDYAHPSINVDDNVLYFSSNRPGGFGGMDLWKVMKNGSSWGQPVNLGPTINTSGHDVFPFIHADGTLFFSSFGHNSMGGLDIFFAKETDGVWGNPVNLGTKFNSSADDLGFIIDRDKRNGYLSSSREEGSGQDDIYSFFIDVPLGEDVFQDPEGENGALASGNTGPFSNTNGSELKGFGNKKVLIFVADRSTGAEMANAKIEYVDLEALTKTEIITDQNGNIIQLISTENGDAVTISKEPGTVSGVTDKEGAFVLKLGNGNYLVNISQPGYSPKQIIVSMADGRDEYMVLLDRSINCVAIKGVTLYDNANPVAGATVSITEDNGASVESLTSSSSGVFEACLPCGKTYVISASKNGVASTKYITTDVNCNNGAPMSVIVTLPGKGGSNVGSDGSLVDNGGPISPGTIIRLAKIYYNFNDASIRPDAIDELNTLASILATYKNINIEIASHTDSRGTDSYNDQLSQRRADKVVAYLVEQGIDPSRLNAMGYGEKQLLNGCSDGVDCSELDHQYNRRTEVRVLDNTVEVMYINNPPESVDSAPPSVFIGSGSSGGSTGGTYYVIAGTFSVKQNAEDRLARVQALGFGDAYIMKGTASNNNAVCVGSFSDYNAARKLADEMENSHNVHTYVRKGG